MLERVNGANAAELTKKVQQYAGISGPVSAPAGQPKEVTTFD